MEATITTTLRNLHKMFLSSPGITFTLPDRCTIKGCSQFPTNGEYWFSVDDEEGNSLGFWTDNLNQSVVILD